MGGNKPGVLDPVPGKDKLQKLFSSDTSHNQLTCTVQTRASKTKRVHPFILPEIEPLNVTPQVFSKLQSNCPSLSKIREILSSRELDRLRDGTEFEFEEPNGLVYRVCVHSNCSQRIGKFSLVVPAECKTNHSFSCS